MALAAAALLALAPAFTGSATSADGVAIRYEGAGAGEPAVVFIHGWCCDRTHWRAQLAHFASSHQVVALDLAGHGESGKERKAWTIAALGEDVRAVVEKLGLARVVLVGHSMGGPVALEAARLLPGRVAAVVGVDTLKDVEERLSKEQKAEFLAPWRADFEGTLRREGPGHLFRPWTDAELVRRVLAEMSAAPPRSAVALMEAFLDYDQAAGLARVKIPIRLINTDQYPTNLAAARKHAPQVELTVMPLRCHFSMIEDPDEFNRLLARAIREMAGSTHAGRERPLRQARFLDQADHGGGPTGTPNPARRAHVLDAGQDSPRPPRAHPRTGARGASAGLARLTREPLREYNVLTAVRDEGTTHSHRELSGRPAAQAAYRRSWAAGGSRSPDSGERSRHHVA